MAISYVFNPFTGTMAPVSIETAKLGGLYGINTQLLTGHKTLVPNVDKIYQQLDPGAASRDIALDTASAVAGDRFVIINTDSYTSIRELHIKEGVITIDKAKAGACRGFIFNGSHWNECMAGSGSYKDYKQNTAIGQQSSAINKSAAFGYNAQGSSYSLGIGYTAQAVTSSIALGYYANAGSYGIAIGYYAHNNSNRYSTAIGFRSENTRYGEFAMNIGGDSDQENNATIVGFAGSTTNNTPIEIYCASYPAHRCDIRAKSALTFKIMVTARDNTSGDCAAYMFDGLIKRDAANNTTMSVCNKTVTHEDDATWDCDVTADDANEALIITVTGDADNTVQWAARLSGVETHF